MLFPTWFQIASTQRQHDLNEPVHKCTRPLTAIKANHSNMDPDAQENQHFFVVNKVCMCVCWSPLLAAWIKKGAAQLDRPNAYERHLWLPPNGHEWSRSTAAKPDVFYLGKDQTTTPGTPCLTPYE